MDETTGDIANASGLEMTKIHSDETQNSGEMPAGSSLEKVEGSDPMHRKEMMGNSEQSTTQNRSKESKATAIRNESIKDLFRVAKENDWHLLLKKGQSCNFDFQDEEEEETQVINKRYFLQKFSGASMSDCIVTCKRLSLQSTTMDWAAFDLESEKGLAFFKVYILGCNK